MAWSCWNGLLSGLWSDCAIFWNLWSDTSSIYRAVQFRNPGEARSTFRFIGASRAHIEVNFLWRFLTKFHIHLWMKSTVYHTSLKKNIRYVIPYLWVGRKNEGPGWASRSTWIWTNAAQKYHPSDLPFRNSSANFQDPVLLATLLSGAPAMSN